MRYTKPALLAAFMFAVSIATAQTDTSHKDFVGKWESEKFKNNFITITENEGKIDAVFSAGEANIETLICKPIVEYGIYYIRLSWRNTATNYTGAGDLELESADRMKLITPKPYQSSSFNSGSSKPNVDVSYYKRIVE